MLVYLKGLYEAHGTLYRLVWTGIQVGAGLVVVSLGADPQVGALVTVLSVVLTSEARKRLGS
jgi:hypothetical protein